MLSGETLCCHCYVVSASVIQQETGLSKAVLCRLFYKVPLLRCFPGAIPSCRLDVLKHHAVYQWQMYCCQS